jgi:peptidoglycan LD-endopeptidase CwlK
VSDRIEDLDPDMQDMALALLSEAQKQQIVLKITHTRRTWGEQADLYALGRTKPGQIVTAAPPGYSWHNFGRAFDVAIVSYPGDATPKNLYDGNWETVGDIGESVGLEWGGRWKHPDRPHFEHHGGTTLALLRKKTTESTLLA